MKNTKQLSLNSPLQKVLSLIFFLMTAMGLLLMLFYLVGDPSVTANEKSRNLAEIIENRPGMARFFLFCQHLLIFIGVPFLYQWVWYTSKDQKLFAWGRPAGKDFLRFAILLVFIFPVISVTAHWVSLLDLPEWMQTMDDDYMESLAAVMSTDSPLDIAITLLIAAVLPGIGEELLFRGTIQKELINVGTKPHAAIWLTAVLFSLLHFQASGFLAKMLIGVVLGYAYHFSGSLWVPIVLHFSNNTAATLAFHFYKDTQSEQTEPVGFTGDQAMVLVVSIIMIVYYFNYLQNTYKRK